MIDKYYKINWIDVVIVALVIISLFLTSCTYVYTVGIKTVSEDWTVHQIEAKKDAQFKICYENRYTLRFFSDMSFKPAKRIGVGVIDYEILNVKKK